MKPALAEATSIRDSLEAFVAGVEEEFDQLKQVLDEEALSSFRETEYPEWVANAMSAEAIPVSPGKGKNKESSRVLIEFCCHPESELGKLASESGVTCHRLSKDWANLEDPNILEQVIQIVRKSPNCHLHASLPCTVWSTWQHVFCHTQGEKYVQRLLRRRRKAVELFKNFVAVATEVRKHGGTVPCPSNGYATALAGCAKKCTNSSLLFSLRLPTWLCFWTHARRKISQEAVENRY